MPVAGKDCDCRPRCELGENRRCPWCSDGADLDVLDLDVAGIPVLRGGRPVPFDEEVATAALSAHEVIIRGKLPGAGFGVAWGSDLTEGYIRINADYRS